MSDVQILNQGSLIGFQPVSEAAKIIVAHARPPIPIRDYDYCAYHDGEEETGHYGYGPTREKALADLQQLNQERAEAGEEQGPIMSTHTPGPWIVNAEQIFGKGCKVASVNDAGHNWQADRDLIAAAPDLADVVRNVAGIDDGWLQDAHPSLLRKAIIDLRDAARAAIAKAEGA